jgi:hypothetical protein
MTETTSHEAKKKRELKRYNVTVCTLAGHHLSEEVHDTERVATLTAKAVREFERRGQLAQGDYALTLLRLNAQAQLDPTATLAGVGIEHHDVLVLVSRQPQVDG